MRCLCVGAMAIFKSGLFGGSDPSSLETKGGSSVRSSVSVGPASSGSRGTPEVKIV